MSMESLGSNAEKVKSQAAEKVREAQEMRQEIDALKSELAGMPSGLDDSIVSAIASAEQAGRDAATSDIGNVEQQAKQAQAEGQQIASEIDTKIGENNSAKSKLEAARSNKYGSGAGDAISAIETNNSQGESIKSDMESAMQAAMSDINSAKSGI